MAKLVSKTYGDALFDLGLEQKSLDSLFEEAKVINEVIKENNDLVKFLAHPKIVKEEKVKVIENIFKGKISNDFLGFLTIVITKDRQNDIIDILTYFTGKVKEYKNIGVAYVTSAVPLNEVQKASIMDKLLKTTKFVEIELHYDVDASLIGGIVIRIGDRVVDSSIKTKLNELSKELLKIQLV